MFFFLLPHKYTVAKQPVKLGKDELEKSKGLPGFKNQKAAVLQDWHSRGGDAEPGCPMGVHRS